MSYNKLNDPFLHTLRFLMLDYEFYHVVSLHPNRIVSYHPSSWILCETAGNFVLSARALEGLLGGLSQEREECREKMGIV